MLRLLIDENVDHRILRGLNRRIPQLDLVLVGDVGLLSAPDPDLLEWAATENRIILTHDAKTLVPYAEQLIHLGQHTSGVILVPYKLEIGRAINDLEILIECMGPSDLRDQIQRLPL